MAIGDLLDRLGSIGAREDEDQQTRIQREALLLGTVLYSGLGIVWGVLYAALGLARAALIPLGYVGFAILVVAFLALSGRFRLARILILLAWLLLPLALQLTLGGFVSGSAVVLWSLGAPMGALFFAPERSHWWAAGFLIAITIAGLAEPTLEAPQGLSPTTIRVFLVLNLAGVGTAVFLVSRDFLHRLQRTRADLEREKERSEALLLDLLPEAIAQRLKGGESVIADRLDEITIVFADLVGFTAMSESQPASDVVDVLNSLVADFDRLMGKHGMEKIRTMGDAYMAVAGAPQPREDHAEVAAFAALEMLETAHHHSGPDGSPMEMRIGIDSGPVVAGVIGLRRFAYDVWGDPVNTASRMESLGVPGGIQVTERVFKRLQGTFSFDERGTIDVKGKGPMPTYLLVGVKESERGRFDP